MPESLTPVAPPPNTDSHHLLAGGGEEGEEEEEVRVGGFDHVPDEISLHILNLVADVRSLAKCRCVSRRLASLVPQAENLLLRVDAVIPSQSEDDQLLPLLHRLLNSLLSTLTSFFFPSSSTSPPSKPPASKHILPTNHPSSSSPSTLLCGFDRVRTLQIELPGGDLRLAEKGAVLRWRAEFGKTLRSCVILAARRMTTRTSGTERNERGEETEGVAVEDGLKERVIWTIGALIAASARHHMVGDVVRGERGAGMEGLAVVDRDGEGRLVIDKEGIEEWREEETKEQGGGGGEEDVLRKGRTTLPAMRMRMRHKRRLELGGGIGMEGAVLVVARAAGGGGEEEEEVEEGEGMLVRRAFGGAFRCAAEELMKKPSYVLDMNSF